MIMRRFPLLFVLLLAGRVFAGGGPENVLVVVNDASPSSLELGQYYQEARGIPERNVFHISTSTNYTIATASFSNEIRNPVLAYIASSGLSNQISYLLFSRDIPYKITQGGSTNGLTAAMFYGFKTNFDPVCSTPT